MFNFDLIDEYQLEITSYCNAACPQCPRNINGKGINPYMPLVHLSEDIIDSTFSKDHCKNLRQIFFCGSYGDPIMHPNFLEILHKFRTKNPKLWLYVHTNGGVHDSEYWKEIAKIMHGYGQIDFGIDGLHDTLHLYRKNVKYDKVINNAKAFINAGGRAQWNYIVFDHNEHQVNQAIQLSKDLGFFNILIRKTGRFFNHQTLEEFSEWPITEETRTLKPPKNPDFRNKSIMFLPNLKQKYKDMKYYFDTTSIKCDALLGKKVSINAEGLVLPCNFFNHNLYDARFYDNSLPCANELSFSHGKNQVRQFIEKYGIETLNIKNNSLQQIFKNKFWSDLVNSFTNEHRLFECAMTCGEKFTKVWDQGGSTR